jgi:acetyl esterase
LSAAVLNAVVARAVGGLLSLPEAALRAFAGPPHVVDGQRLDLQTQALLRLAALTAGGGLRPADVAGVRRGFELQLAIAPPRPPLASVVDRAQGRLRARVYTPIGAEVRAPAVVYFHGGGWVVGSLESADRVCAELARISGCVVASIDYRLAPEHPFPAAVEDALEAFAWVSRDHQALGIDPERIAVAGDSAGGTLSAVVSNELARAPRRPAYQLLIYPATDLSRERPSYQRFGEGYILSAEAMRWFVGHYLPDPALRADPRASPLLCGEIAGTAPACVAVAGYDVLRDEGLAYADRLRSAGALDALVIEPSLVHGFASMTHFIVAAERALDRMARRLGQALRQARPIAASAAPSPG